MSSSRNCRTVLHAAKLAHLFDERIDGEVAGQLGLAGKPAPDTFLAAADRLGVSPTRAAVIEDALSGVEAGRRGGFAAGGGRGSRRTRPMLSESTGRTSLFWTSPSSSTDRPAQSTMLLRAIGFPRALLRCSIAGQAEAEPGAHRRSEFLEQAHRALWRASDVYAAHVRPAISATAVHAGNVRARSTA